MIPHPPIVDVDVDFTRSRRARLAGFVERHEDGVVGWLHTTVMTVLRAVVLMVLIPEVSRGFGHTVTPSLYTCWLGVVAFDVFRMTSDRS